MTNKEAIAYIQKYCYGAWCEDEWREAMDAAIEALKTTACNNLATDLQPSKQDDLISKQEVINTVRKIIYGFFSDEDGAMTDTEKTLLSINKATCNGVRELPSAQPKHDISKANFLCPICGVEMEVAVSEWEGENE